jgi:hypothetical protein
MICADEIKLALTMLENLPGYYRDNFPERAKRIRSSIYEQCMTVQDYINDMSETTEGAKVYHASDLGKQWSEPHFTPRGTLLISLVKDLNKQGLCAEIIELGPYNYWLPAGLQDEACDFIYTPMSINPHAKCPITTKTSSDNPIKKIFVCFEVIEHLWNEDEIFHYFCKTQMDPDFVLISTPKHTCGGGLPNWNQRQLGHVRTWTPKELTQYCTKHWSNLNWYMVDAAMMISIGSKEKINAIT